MFLISIPQASCERLQIKVSSPSPPSIAFRSDPIRSESARPGRARRERLDDEAPSVGISSLQIKKRKQIVCSLTCLARSLASLPPPPPPSPLDISLSRQTRLASRLMVANARRNYNPPKASSKSQHLPRESRHLMMS